MSFLRYLLKKSFYALLTLWGLVTLIFLLFRAMPDPAQLTMGQRTDQQSIEAARKDMGLDKPLYYQYMMYLNDLSPVSLYSSEESQSIPHSLILFKGEWDLVIKFPFLRYSYQSRQSVSTLLGEAFEGTFFLSVFAMLIAVMVGIFLGLLAGFYSHRWPDRLVLFITNLGISMPSFFAAILIAWLFGYVWKEYTGLSMTGSLVDFSIEQGRFYAWQHIILPGIALGIRPLAIISQLTRSSLLDVLQQEYITTAYAKGLSPWQVIRRHALRNVLNPVITSITGWFASLMAGAFFVEYIFNWKGLGKITVDALEKADYPVVSGAVLLVGILFIILNILADLSYKWLDPRVKL